VNLGNVADKKGDFNKSLDWHHKALKLRLQLRGSDDPAIADIHNLIGGDYFHKGDYKRAIESFNEALRIYRQVHGEDHTKLAEVFSNIGAVYLKERKYSDALGYQQKVLDIQKKTSPWLSSSSEWVIHQHCCPASQHPDIANIYNNMAGIYVDKRDLQQVLFYFEKAAAILHQTVGPTHPSAVDVQKNIQYIRSFIHKRK
jgi:tetratricopeptide (TPR) repeat protein